MANTTEGSGAGAPPTSPAAAPKGKDRPTFWVIVCLVLAAILYISIPYAGEWIELFNGATWPAKLSKSATEDSLLKVPFAVVLAIRTLLNLSGAIIVIYAIYRFMPGTKERAMQKTLQNVRAVQYASLQFHMTAFLNRHEGQVVGPELVDEFKHDLQAWISSDVAQKLDGDLATMAVESRMGV